MKKLYYIEFISKTLDTRQPYLMQSRYFDTQKKAVNWFRKNFDYVDKNEIGVELMVVNFINEDDYEINTVEAIN